MAVNPLLLDIPDHLETARLHIRAPRPGDGAAVNEAIRESFPELHEWMPWAKELPTDADSEEFVRRASASYQTRTDLPLLIFQSDTGLFLGGTGFHRINWDVPCFEIGYWVRTAHSGRGYITEAVLGLTAVCVRSAGRPAGGNPLRRTQRAQRRRGLARGLCPGRGAPQPPPPPSLERTAQHDDLRPLAGGDPETNPVSGRNRVCSPRRCYSTVTLLARLRGWSTSAPRRTAIS